MKTDVRTRVGTIREDLASLRIALDVFMEGICGRLDGITERLDQINGSVRRHESWIAGREPVCHQSLENVAKLATAVTTITTILAEQRGETRAKARMAKVANMAVIALTAIGSAWAAVHVALASVRP